MLQVNGMKEGLKMEFQRVYKSAPGELINIESLNYV